MEGCFYSEISSYYGDVKSFLSDGAGSVYYPFYVQRVFGVKTVRKRSGFF